MQFWIDQAKTGPGSAKSEAIKVLKTAFDIHGIIIPVKGSEVTPAEAKKDLI